MGRRKQRFSTPWGDAPDGQVWHTETKLNNRHVGFGHPLKFKGRRGVFNFIKYVERADGGRDWIDVFEPRTGQFRAFYSDTLSQVKARQSTPAKRKV